MKSEIKKRKQRFLFTFWFKKISEYISTGSEPQIHYRKRPTNLSNSKHKIPRRRQVSGATISKTGHHDRYCR